MSDWMTYQLHERITEILSDVPEYSHDHHFGRPCLTPYQIAIEFAQRYPADFGVMDRSLGGADSNDRRSLAWYISDQLSKMIARGQVLNIEGVFFDRRYLSDDMIFQSGNTTVTISTRVVTLYRLRQ